MHKDKLFISIVLASLSLTFFSGVLLGTRKMSSIPLAKKEEAPKVNKVIVSEPDHASNIKYIPTYVYVYPDQKTALENSFTKEESLAPDNDKDQIEAFKHEMSISTPSEKEALIKNEEEYRDKSLNNIKNRE